RLHSGQGVKDTLLPGVPHAEKRRRGKSPARCTRISPLPRRLGHRPAAAVPGMKKVLLPTEGREAHGRPGRIVVLEATKRGRPWPKWIVCPSWVAGRVIAYGIGVRR